MDENLTGRQKLGLVFKEMKIVLSNGVLLGVASFVALGLYVYLAKGKPLMAAFAISGCICIALLLAMSNPYVCGMGKDNLLAMGEL